jgi:hypothetical protein
MIPLTKTETIVETIRDIVLFHVVFTCVNNQCCGYWLSSNALTFAIKLYLNLSKEKLELQAEIDAIENIDMHMKVKQLSANM